MRTKRPKPLGPSASREENDEYILRKEIEALEDVLKLISDSHKHVPSVVILLEKALIKTKEKHSRFCEKHQLMDV